MLRGPPISPARDGFRPMGAERSANHLKTKAINITASATPSGVSAPPPGACGSAQEDGRAVLGLEPGSLSRCLGDRFLIVAQIPCNLCKRKKYACVGLSQGAGLFVPDPKCGQP